MRRRRRERPFFFTHRPVPPPPAESAPNHSAASSSPPARAQEPPPASDPDPAVGEDAATSVAPLLPLVPPIPSLLRASRRRRRHRWLQALVGRGAGAGGRPKLTADLPREAALRPRPPPPLPPTSSAEPPLPPSARAVLVLISPGSGFTGDRSQVLWIGCHCVDEAGASGRRFYSLRPGLKQDLPCYV